MLAAAAEAEAEAMPVGPAALSGMLRLTAPATFGRKVLAPVLADLLFAHPALRLDLLQTDAVVDLVETGRDAAVRIAQVLSGQSLVARRVGESRLVLCAAPSYLARRGTQRDPDDLAAHDALMFEAVDGWVLQTPGGALRHGRLAARMASNSNEALREACLAGLGIGLHSTWDVGEHLARGELLALPETVGAPPPLGVWLVLPGAPVGVGPPARVRAFAQALRGHLGDAALRATRD